MAATEAKTLNDQDLRDLGFGAVISRESHTRLLNRDGSFNVERRGLRFWQTFSAYHFMLTVSWWQFFGVVVALYLLANAGFALAYVACGPGALGTDTIGIATHPFLRAFFFSVETLSTIGYGHVVPIGIAANTIVTIEAFVGLVAVAIMTGLLFARFSKPNAKMLFSRTAVLAPYRDITAFEFRVANGRSNEVIEVSANLLFSRFEDIDGVRTRRFYPLALERSKVTFLPLTWTVVHPIDETSPMYGETMETLRDKHAEFLVLLTGFDETVSATIYQRTSFVTGEIREGARFANAFLLPQTTGAKVAFDMRKFDEIEPAAVPPPALNR